MVKVAAALILIAGLTACSAKRGAVHDKCIEVGQAIAQTSGDERASVCGFMRFRFEDKNLYKSEQAAIAHPHRECLAIGLANGFSQDLSRFDGEQVRVFGTLMRSACPEGALCFASCPGPGVLVESVELIKQR